METIVRDIVFADLNVPCEIGDGSSDLPHAIVTARAQPKAFDRARQDAAFDGGNGSGLWHAARALYQ